MGRVILKRQSTYGDKLRAYKIFVDDLEVGKIKDGEVWTHSVSQGEHTLQLKVDWCKTPQIKFVSQEQDCEFECHSNVTGWKVPFVILFLFMPSKWIALRKRT